jgi:hypothetical protein
MKSILYFVRAGRVSDAHKKAAEVIKKETGFPVSFRNGTVAEISGENPEACHGVAGQVPARYDKFTRYNDKGVAASAKASEEKEDGAVGELGLPEGHPANIKDLKKALKEAGLEFHGRAKSEVLVELYRDHFLTEN